MQQNTNEWHELRRKSLGASDAPVIMGVSPYKTPYQLWQEKLGLFKQEETPAMAAGKKMEEQIRLDFEKATSLLVFPVVKYHAQHKWIIASMDGVTLDGRVAVELKMANRTDHDMALQNKVPDKYYPQLQHQMFVGGWKSMYYYSWHQGDGKYVIVERDDEYIKELYDKENVFYSYMQTYTPPPFTDRDIINQESELWKELASEYLRACEIKSCAEENMEKLKAQLINICGGLNSKGAGISLTKTVRKGSIDYQAVPQLRDVNLDDYRKKPTEVWTIRRDDV